MSEDKGEDLPEDLEGLARRYVDLWQDQMTALASDPAFAESLQKVMASMGVAASGLPAMWSAWPAALTSMMAAAQPIVPASAKSARSDVEEQTTHGKPGGDRTTEQGGAASPGAAAAAAPSNGSRADLDGLEERLAALEQRLIALERKPAKGGTGRARGDSQGKPKRS